MNQSLLKVPIIDKNQVQLISLKNITDKIGQPSTRSYQTRKGKIQFIPSGKIKTFRRLQTYRYNKYQAKSKLRQITLKLFKYYTLQQLFDTVIKKQLNKQTYPYKKQILNFVRQTFQQGLNKKQSIFNTSVTFKTIRGDYVQYIKNAFALIQFLEKHYLEISFRELNRCSQEIQNTKNRINQKIRCSRESLYIYNRIKKSPYTLNKMNLTSELEMISHELGQFKELSNLTVKIHEKIEETNMSTSSAFNDLDIFFNLINSKVK